MTAARPLPDTGPDERPDDAAIARLIGSGESLFVLASTDDCVPCTLMKPIVRELAARLTVAFALAEPGAASQFLERHGVERFPELLLFRNGALVDRRIGFDGIDDLDAFMRRALGQTDAPVLSEPDIAFRARIDAARGAVDALMAPARAALAPFMAAAGAELLALDTRLRAIEATGEMTSDAAQRLRRTEQARIYAPFQDRIEALRAAQDKAMQLYEEMTRQAAPACAPYSSRSNTSMLCSPDGSVCSLVFGGPDETAR